MYLKPITSHSKLATGWAKQLITAKSVFQGALKLMA